MRERVTFVHEGEAAFDEKQLEVRKESIRITNLKASREDRLTLSFQELPQEIWRVLKQCHELHIRWSSADAFTLQSPFNARISPGLHVFFTPHRSQPSHLLCPLLKKLFGGEIKCASVEKAFTPVSVLSERFANSASHQYHQVLPSLSDLSTYLAQKICSSGGTQCLARAEAIASADYLDIDYDSISQALVIKTYRHQSPTVGGKWNEEIKAIEDIKLEIGILAPEQATEAEDLKMGGFLVAVGEDDKPKPTLFSFPSRHHPPPQHRIHSREHSDRAGLRLTFSVSFVQPTGLHPQLRLSINSPSPLDASKASSCSLHSYLTLLSPFFPDKYQLANPLLLQSLNIRAIRSIAGYTDLEAPDYAVEAWGSSMLVELAPPENLSEADEWNATIPLHLRYLAPTNDTDGISETDLPWPIVFWACPAEEGGGKMSTNPFDRVNLGYDGLFAAGTVFHHLNPVLKNARAEEQLIGKVKVPVLDAGWWGMREGCVEGGIGAVILLGWLWIVWKLWMVAIRDRQREKDVKRAKKE